ncbi:MAG: serine hydrolase domain-containing protein [Thermoanaerobaculia bacterium]
MSGAGALAVSQLRAPTVDRPTWLQQLVDGVVEGGLATSVAAVVGGARWVSAAAASGDARSASGEGEPLFDLASLTKLWTASLALRLDARGSLPLGTPLGALWPNCDRRLARRTLEELLRHRAGFQPWAPIYRRCRRRSTVAGLLVGGQLLGARRGTYSDLDYMLWGLSAKHALGRSLAELLRRELVGPLGLEAAPTAGAVWLPCALGNGREVELAAAQGIRVGRLGPPETGRVQDGNARFLGAPAGHAGLFASPRALFALAREWLSPGALWSAAASAAALSGPGRFVVGWRRASRRGSGGPALSPGSYGHVGFTGGSVWVDPQRHRILVLLAHRASLSADLAPARRRFHALASAARDSA